MNRTIYQDKRVRTQLTSGWANPGYFLSSTQTGGDSLRDKKFHLIPTENAYSRTLIETYQGVVHYTYGDRPTLDYTGTMASLGFLPGKVPFSSSFSSNDITASYNRLLGKIRGHSFNLAVASAEGKETIEMLHGSMVTVLSAYVSLRHGNVKKTVSIFRKGTSRRKWRVPPRLVRNLYTQKSFADKWLSLRYGWVPFLSDCYSAAEAISTYLERKDRQEYSVRTGKKISQIQTQRDSSLTPAPKVKYDHRLQHIAKFKYNSSVYQAFSDLGLLDPASVAWEVMPYSFVVDWFLPIGNYLEARAGANTFSQCTIVTTKFRKQELLGYEPCTNNQSPYAVILKSGFSGDKDVFVEIIRTITTSGFSIPLPEFQNPLAGSWKHFVDTFALWRNRSH